MKRSLSNNSYVISAISKISIIFFSFISSVIISRYLGPNLKGQYSYILNYVTIISLILNLGVGQSYTYFLKTNGEGIKQEFVNLYYIQFVSYLMLIIVVNIFKVNFVINVILIASTISVLNSQINFMALVNDVNKRNLINIKSTVLYTLILISIYLLSNRNLNLVIVAFIVKLVINSLMNIISASILPNRFTVNIELLKKIIKFSFFPMITTLLITFNYNIDIIILERYLEFREVGIYSIGVSLASMLWIIPDAFKDVLFNKTAKSDSINEIAFSIKFNIYLSTFIIILFAFIGRYFIEFVYGSDFIDAYGVTLLLFIGCIPMIFFKMINTLYIAIGKQIFAFYILVFAVIINVLANIILIPKMGIEGAAIASIASYSICGTIFLASFTKKYMLKLTDVLILNKNDLIKIKQLARK